MKWKDLLAGLLAVLMLLPTNALAAETTTPAESATVQAQTAEEDWRLILVNPWNTIPDGYTVKLKKLANGMQVDERIYDDLNAMLIACWNAGLKPYVCSAYRTTATQKRLYNNKVARLQKAGYSLSAAKTEAARWVAKPGTSEHQLGLALDIVSSDYRLLNKNQENTPEQKWLMEHCWEYGFILRYPTDKSDITGIGYEPWHYRYVGRENALAIRDSGLCLEEYLQALQSAAAEESELAAGEATGVTTTMDQETTNQETAAAVS
jgi:D-alanyl-D-alanine carboxypeptidase